MNDWKTLGAAALLGSALQLANTAQAQCYVTDGLDGPCCAQVVLNTPTFPMNFIVDGSGACFDACVAGPKVPLVFEFSIPFSAPTSCVQDMGLFVKDSVTLAPLMFGSGNLDYMRTWEELTPSGDLYQVWRFHMKIELRPDVIGAATCPVPSCIDPAVAGAYPETFFYGYLDFAEKCSSPGVFEHAMMLFHGCDRLSHDPLLSFTPGTFHPTRNYALVAPDTAANPFVYGATPPPAGPLTGEAMRRGGTFFDPTVPDCFTENPIASGGMGNLISGCLCPLSFTPPLQTARRLLGTGACTDAIGVAGSFGSRNFYPSAPWFFLLTTSIGRWTTTSAYPGPERIFADEGLFDYYEVCSDPAGVGLPAGPSIDLFYGSTTRNGYNVVPNPGAAQTNVFTDLASNAVFVAGVPVVLPIVGLVMPSDHLIYVNY